MGELIVATVLIGIVFAVFVGWIWLLASAIVWFIGCPFWIAAVLALIVNTVLSAIGRAFTSKE